ncbi:MAG TPA: hypothetical protein VGE30_01025 [Candidatus Saccharimonadales bacterium]
MSKQQQDPNEDGEATRRPNVRGGGRSLRAAVGLVAVLMVAVGLVGVTAGTASAHTGKLTPTPKCVEGKTEILWSGTTSNVPAGVTATVNIIDVQPTGSTIGAVTPNPVQPNGTFSFTQTVPGDATFAQAVAHIKWSNGVVDDPIGQVNLPGDCKPTTTEVTPAAPSATTPDCTNPNMTVMPGSQPGVVWNPSSATTLTPGQSVTYTASPADTYNFPAGQQTSWSFTNNFNVEECITKVIPAAPTVTTASCEQPNIQANAADQLGVLWNEELPFLLAPGESVTLVASPADGFAFPANAVTSWTFTNDFKVEDCEETPPSVGYAGSVSGDCSSGYAVASVDKQSDARVKFTLWVGNDSKSFWVKPGDTGRTSLKGEPGDRVRLVAKGKTIAAGHMKKNCGHNPPNPPNPPTPPTPEPECVGYDTNGDGVISQDECVPTTTADTGLEDVVSTRSTVGASQALMLMGTGLLFGLFLLRRPSFAGLRRRR